MSNEINELSIGDLDEVGGGSRYYPAGASLTPSIPIPPPVLGPLGPGPIMPGGHSPIVFTTLGSFIS
jgi:hypothetical protein